MSDHYSIVTLHPEALYCSKYSGSKYVPRQRAETCRHCGQTLADHEPQHGAETCVHATVYAPGPSYAELEERVRVLRHALLQVKGYAFNADTGDEVQGVRADDMADVVALIDAALQKGE
jgi:hypothetical protein